jgi:hypothetical protein
LARSSEEIRLFPGAYPRTPKPRQKVHIENDQTIIDVRYIDRHDAGEYVLPVPFQYRPRDGHRQIIHWIFHPSVIVMAIVVVPSIALRFRALDDIVRLYHHGMHRFFFFGCFYA